MRDDIVSYLPAFIGPANVRFMLTCTGADPGFQVRRGIVKIIAPSGTSRENVWGIACEKSRFYAKNSYFSNFRGGARPVRHCMYVVIHFCDRTFLYVGSFECKRICVAFLYHLFYMYCHWR